MSGKLFSSKFINKSSAFLNKKSKSKEKKGINQLVISGNFVSKTNPARINTAIKYRL